MSPIYANQPTDPAFPRKKKRGCCCYRSYTDCSAYLPYRTYMYNHQQAVSSRPMKKIKTKGKKRKKKKKRKRNEKKKKKKKRKRKKEKKRKEKKRQSRVQEDEQTCPFSFSLARVAQIPGTVSFDLHHEQLENLVRLVPT